MDMCPKTEQTGRDVVLGVIGGMGPEATFDFCKKIGMIINANDDQGNLRQLIDCNPHIPDRDEANLGLGQSPAPILQNMAENLERAGATVLAMPCNAAHAYKSKIVKNIKIPFVDMIEETAREFHASEFTRPGILATDACINSKVYEREFARYDLSPVYLDTKDQKDLMNLIYRIKAGKGGFDSRGKVVSLINKLGGKGADSVILACTELPLIVNGIDVPLFVISSTDALARSIVNRYHKATQSIC